MPRRASGKVGLLLGILLMFGCASPPPTTALDEERLFYSEEEIDALFAATEFQPVLKVQDFPEPVEGWIGFMANRGEPFNLGCLRSEDLPSKGLIFGGRSENKVFLLFYQGAGVVGFSRLCEAYEITGATAREVPIEGCFRKSRQDTLVYLKHLLQDWPEATRDPVASNPKPGA